MSLQRWAMIRPQFEDRQSSTGEILLMTKVLVADDQQVKARCFRRLQQRAVFERAPAEFRGGLDFVIG